MERLLMNEKERLRKAILEMVRQRKLTLKQASLHCSISYRQAKRAYRRYKAEGDAGLVHQARGQTSNRRHLHREAIIARYREKYESFGPTLAEEDNLFVNHETLREWLLSENLWCKQRKRSPYRRQRERKPQFGELIQIDGSIHNWLEEGHNRCLLNRVGDATGKIHAHMDSEETTRCIFIAIWQWILRYGIPLVFYVDLKSVYVSCKEGSFSFVEKPVKSSVFVLSKLTLLKRKVELNVNMAFIKIIL